MILDAHSRFHPYGVYVWISCLGIPWKIRIIFSDTTSFKHKLYSVYFVSVCRLDILARIQSVEWVKELVRMLEHSGSNLFSTRWQSNFHISDQPSKTTICRNAFEWNWMWVDCVLFSRHITVYVSGEKSLGNFFLCRLFFIIWLPYYIFFVLVKMVSNLFDGLFCL